VGVNLPWGETGSYQISTWQKIAAH